MPARIVQLGNDVVALVNGADIDDAPNAVRVAITRFDIATEQIKIDVLDSDDRTFGRSTRASLSDDATIDVVIYAKVPAGRMATPAVDNVAAIAESIIDLYAAPRTSDGYTSGVPTWTRLERDWVIEYGVVGYVIGIPFSLP